MIRQGIIYGFIIVSNSIFLSATILSPLKLDPTSLHWYKSGLRNDLDYILKRSSMVRRVDENPDSKERRSQMGSSFIRFGRGNLDNSNENVDYLPININEADTEGSRIPRGRSDVIIRFGRGGLRGKTDILRSRGRLLKIFPIDLEEATYFCPDVIASSHTEDIAELLRLCTSLSLGANETEKNNE